MQRITAIFLLFIFSVSAIETGQFFKMPLLVQHYQAHSKMQEEISILDFLKQHYTGHHQDDGDKNEDEQLPFKSLNHNNISSFFLSPFLEIFENPENVNSDYTYYPHPFISSDHLIGVFHPPRIG